MKGIYRYERHFRGGIIEGLFVANTEDIEILLDLPLEIYFGEVLGKYSEVYCPPEEDDFTLVSTSPKDIEYFLKLDLMIGSNPLFCSYIEFDIVEFFGEDTVEQDFDTIYELIEFYKEKNELS